MPGRDIDIIVFPGFQPLDAIGPHEVFAGANQALEQLGRSSPPYEISIRAIGAGEIMAESGLQLVARGLARRAPHTAMIVGGDGVFDAMADPAMIRWLRTHAPRCTRVASVCSGAFVLAAAGLLDGRTATTHWARAAQLAREFPAVKVLSDSIFTSDGGIWTSAGVTAGIDLALALVEDDHGDEVAQLVARWLVVFLRRPGGQSQFATGVWSERRSSSPVQHCVDLVHAKPGADWTLSRLAATVAVSERHLVRLFRSHMDTSPAKYVERVRIEAARHLLERNDDGLAVIAESCGFGTTETMRRTFLRVVGVAPSDYRTRFRTRIPATVPA